MSNLKLEFVVYLGDPDEGASAVSIAKAVEKIDEYKDKLSFSEGVYGVIKFEKNGKSLADTKADPAISLITKFVRAVPFLIDGEQEQALLSESEYGFMFEPSGDDVLISFFAGSDPTEPDEILIEREAIALDAFAEQMIGTAERMVTIIKACDAELLKKDDYATSMMQFLDMAKASFRTFRLERERGVRR